VGELTTLGIGTTEGIWEEQNGERQNKALKAKTWVKRIDQKGVDLP
jgi:hypothetical protein